MEHVLKKHVVGTPSRKIGCKLRKSGFLVEVPSNEKIEASSVGLMYKLSGPPKISSSTGPVWSLVNLVLETPTLRP